MLITSISVGWKETCSLPEYSNISPSITLTASVEQGENIEEVRERLLMNCKQFVQGEIDLALEQNGQSPKFDSESPRYNLYQRWRSGTAGMILIVPASARGEKPDEYMRIDYLFHGDMRINSNGLRLDAIRKFAKMTGENHPIIELLDLDDLSKLSSLAEQGSVQQDSEVPF